MLAFLLKPHFSSTSTSKSSKPNNGSKNEDKKSSGTQKDALLGDDKGSLFADKGTFSGKSSTDVPPPPYVPRTTASSPSSTPQVGGPVSESYGPSSDDYFEVVARRRQQQELQYLLQKWEVRKGLKKLKKYDTVIIVDDSESMSWDDRWPEARDALAILVDAAAQYDTDGVDIHFLNNDTHRIVKTSAQVHLLFDQVQPRGLTPLGKRLKELTDLYLDRLRYETKGSKVKPVNYLVITDGFPSDNPAVVIADLARTLDDMRRPIKQLGIQFVQIGNDHRAAEYLRGLDGDIHALDVRRDIVDATPFNGGEKLSGEKIIKILMGGLDRDIDRRG